MPKLPDLVFTGFRGRNNADPPFQLLQGQCREALNISFYRSAFGRKRGGFSSVSTTGGTAFGGSRIAFIGRFIVDDDEGNAELFAVDANTPELVKRLAGGTTWADVTLTDTIDSEPHNIDGVSLNGKFFLAYDSDESRLQVYDPADAKVRRVGLRRPVAPTVADTGSGSYGANVRYYKVAYTIQSSGVTIRRSELSPASAAFTPSGSGTAARVTKPASVSEDETHWEVYGSPDDDIYYLLATTVVGTTTYDDSTDPDAYTGDAPPSAGLNICPPSAKYLVADDSRLLMAGAWETGGDAANGETVLTPNNRIWWTARLGTEDVGDDERVPNITGVTNSYIDVEEPITGLGGPLLGSVYVFSYRRVWKLVQTGQGAAPYIRIPVGGDGCIDHKSIVLAEDETGNPALYWLSPDGPFRVGGNGKETMVEDIRDEWDTVNLEASVRVGFGVYYKAKHQIWWWVSTGSNNIPDTCLVFDTRLGRTVEQGKVRYGWSVWDMTNVRAVCGTLFADTLGASMSSDLKPYVGLGGAATILKGDTGTQDNSNSYQAYVDCPEIAPWGLARTGQLSQEAYLHAEASAGVTIQMTADRDWGTESTTATASIAAGASETRVRVRFEGLLGADLEVAKFRVGDSAAANNSWNLDSLVVPISSAGRDGAGD